MRKTSKLISFAAAAALLLSGCGTGTPAPAVSDSGTITSAVETTTAEVTTTAATTTTASTTTTVTTTAEPEPVKVPARIWAATAPKKDNEPSLYVRYNDQYDSETGLRTITDGSIYRQLSSWSSEDYDKNLFFNYELDESTSHVIDSNDKKETLVVDAGASDIYVRASTYSFSESKESDIDKRVKYSKIMRSEKFPSAYNIVWDDPRAELVKVTGDEDYYKVSNPEVRRYKEINRLELGWHTDDIVTVNALVCADNDGISVLVDPEYMYGLPMFADSEYKFSFGGNVVYSDSILFTATPLDGYALDVSDYAYAKVKLKDVTCAQIQNGSVIKTVNTCTLADIEIIDEFSDITEYNISSDDHVIAGMDKDPVMKEVYDAVMTAKSDIYTGNTYGIVFLDLDFDGKPEVIVSHVGDEQSSYDRTFDADVYRVADGAMKYIDTMHLCYSVVYYDGGVIGLSQLKDGTPAWFATTRTYRDDNVEGFYEEDYLYTLDGDKLNMHPLFTHRETDDQITVNGDTEKLDYYFYDEQIVPTITVEEVGPYNEPDWELLSWNGSSAWFGMWELFGFARAKFAGSITTSYSLYSDWLTSGFTMGEPVRYELSDREFAHKIAYMIDDFYYGGTVSINHSYWFLGDYAKPVIYLYPEEQTDVSVQVNFPLGGEFTCTYPEYGDGWNVTAMPDGTLYDANGDEYYCLYWEGKSRDVMDDSKGFCVAGKDTAKFMREKLIYIGLSAREANEFIIYWLPKMQDNPYNIITLHTDDYARSVPLTVSPAPDTQIRVFMTYYSSDTPVDIPEQELLHYERTGFTLVEWGGSEE